MAPLPDKLRRQLERTVIEARKLAEPGAKKALESLAVHLPRSHDSMGPEQKKLRGRLRAHGKQFGDRRDERDGQEIGRLVREVAYEHWHRMLFARFLAENGFLIEPSNQVPVSLGDVEDLARERGVDPWSMAAQFAQRMLPQIFRQDDPVLQVPLPPETTQALQRLVVGLDPTVFTADDALGWTYQFWQSAEKDAVNARVKSGEKISGETLPAVTQLFTEHYMVQFLLHNTLGAWHAGKVLQARPELATTAQSEAELRAAVALPGHPFEYLRFVREGDDKPWRPAAGVFAGWPKAAKELKVLDPCCGSGHFLVAAFELLVALRQHEEGLPVGEAVAAVLGGNLFGLELDPRCTQIAAFALASAVWKKIGGVVELPALQVACCGLGPAGTKEQWLKLADATKLDEDRKNALRRGMEKLHNLFSQAPELGSLIDPRQLREDGFAAPIDRLLPLLELALRADGGDEDQHERAVAAQGMAKAAAILGQTFALVVTNVPYLGRGAHGDVLREYAEQHYPDAKADLATVFVQRAFEWLGKCGTMAVVTPQNWLFQTSYRKVRERLLKERTWIGVAKLGEEAWWSFGIRGPRTVLLVLGAAPPSDSCQFFGVDVSTNRGERLILLEEKASLLRGEVVAKTAVEVVAVEAENSEVVAEGEADGDALASGPADGSARLVLQGEQLKNPDARVLTRPQLQQALLARHADSFEGMTAGDLSRFVMCFWEAPLLSRLWSWFVGAAEKSCLWSAREQIIRWEEGGGPLQTEGSAAIKGREAWGHRGIRVHQMQQMACTLYDGELFDKNGASVVPSDPAHLTALHAFLTSDEFRKAVRRVDQALKVTVKTFTKVPFDLAHWQRIAAEQYPHGLPAPQTNDPTQWLFHGHPAGMTAAGRIESSPFGIPDITGPGHASLICRTPNPAHVLQVATARLLGYQWPAELDELMHLDTAQRAWATRSRELVHYADTDGIVCLSPIRGEPSAAERLRELLRAAFGPRWYPETERKLIEAAAQGSKPAADLDAWLRDEFFAAHCKLFHERPFVWHLWDGRKDGFHALVNYHKLAGANGGGRRTLELLTFTYLNDWIERQRLDLKAGEAGAEARLAAAVELQEELKKILHGEPPYDLFVRWKALHQQPLGWEPDINDGVRLNIRPFMLSKDVRQKGAGLLRSKVAVKWTKDRGKEPESLRPRDQFPWFWSCNPELPAHQRDYLAPKTAAFDGVRWNDLHYSRAVKEAASKRKAEGGQA